MKVRVLVAAALVLVTSVTAAAEPDVLRSRGFAGFGYRSLTEEEAAPAGLTDADGVAVTVVLAGSPAELAGLMEGDIVVAVDEHQVSDASSIPGIMRGYYAGDKAVLDVRRGEETVSMELTFAASRERSEGVDVEYTSFLTYDGHRLRAVVTSPSDTEGEKLPALLLVSALVSPRLADMPGYGMMRSIAYEVTGAGFRVMRFELRGSGDSEGEDYRTTDLATEVDDNLRALDYLMGRDDVDASGTFVMGHSTGGIVAAELAAQRDLAGLVVSCTIGRTYYERMMETLRIQSELGGDAPAETDSIISDYLSLSVAVASGESLESITTREPRLSRFVNAHGRIMDDRTSEYWRQQLNLNLPEIYGAIQEPVLIVYAASDFLTQLACHERIRDVLKNSGNADVTLAVIEGLDHAYTAATDKAESFEHYGTGGLEANPEPIALIREWSIERIE
jgi:alpha-beta hydrolase superfamily lysophospholipase